MRHDPIEFAMIGAAARGRRTVRRPSPEPPTCSAVDEAFADFIRVDPQHDRTTAVSDRPSPGHALVATLATSLEALDRHREQLARLLQSIETDAVSE